MSFQASAFQNSGFQTGVTTTTQVPDRGFGDTLEAFSRSRRRETDEKDLCAIMELEAKILLEALKFIRR